MYLLPNTLRHLDYGSLFDRPPASPTDFQHIARLTALTSLKLFGLEQTRNLDALWQLSLLQLDVDRCCFLEFDILSPGALQSLQSLTITAGRRCGSTMLIGYSAAYTGNEEHFLARLKRLRSIIAALPELKELEWDDNFSLPIVREIVSAVHEP